jgi:DNA-binding TFAR19-related protein (PDSD5 family)
MFHIISHLIYCIRNAILSRSRKASLHKSHSINKLAESLSLPSSDISALRHHIEQHTREGLESVDLRRPHDANNGQEPIVGLIATGQFTHRICLYTKRPEEASEQVRGYRGSTFFAWKDLSDAVETQESSIGRGKQVGNSDARKRPNPDDTAVAHVASVSAASATGVTQTQQNTGVTSAGAASSTCESGNQPAKGVVAVESDDRKLPPEPAKAIDSPADGSVERNDNKKPTKMRTPLTKEEKSKRKLSKKMTGTSHDLMSMCNNWLEWDAEKSSYRVKDVHRSNNVEDNNQNSAQEGIDNFHGTLRELIENEVFREAFEELLGTYRTAKDELASVRDAIKDKKSDEGDDEDEDDDEGDDDDEGEKSTNVSRIA